MAREQCPTESAPTGPFGREVAGLPGGKARRGKSRTSLTLTILAGTAPAARGASRLAYHFEGTEPPGYSEPPDHVSRQYRNPIMVAQEWQSMLDRGGCASRADLARRLCVTHARVTQVLSMLDLAPDVLDTIVALGDPLSTLVVTERGLRPLLRLPFKEHGRALVAIAPAQ